MKKTINLLFQIIKFGGVGIVCFIVDFTVLTLLTELLHFNVLVSAAVAFSVSVVLNYFLSSRFVFDTNPDADKRKMFIQFIVFSVIGLILTELIMKTGVDFLRLDYRFVKVIATGIVMCYNFITRKVFMEK